MAVYMGTLALVGNGCAGRHAYSPASPSSSIASGALPPDDVTALAPIIDPIVGPLELRLSRAAVEDRSTVASGPTERHLVLYVRPLGASSDDRVIQNILPLARALTPFVFQRWPGLGSYDVCQEIPGAEASATPNTLTVFEAGATPDTLTVFDVSRAYAQAHDLSRTDLRTLVADYRSVRPGIRLAVIARLQPVLDASIR